MSHSPRARFLPPIRRFTVAIALVAAAVFLGGCAAPLTMSQEQERQRLAQLVYPAEAEYGPDLDIVVRRDGDHLTLINRTARSYRDVRIWLNQQYVREVPLIKIGPGNRLGLNRFINQHREPFPVGTLLAPDAAFPVVLAELLDLDTGLRHRLLVWPDETNQR
ncbi:MAG: hypothetical protein AAF086_04040 [Planctomycetota bacterium]